MGGPPVKALMSPEVAGTVWKENVELADKANQPGKFTAFCSYEWTSMPNNMNLHRNIFFKDCAKVPAMPFSALDSSHPVDLWNWMDGQRKAGNDVPAISHNANLSDGRMYPTEVDSKGRPIDAAYAASRVRNEPLIEIKQMKGTSETHPLLSPNDEFASFEIMSILLGDPPGRIPHIVGSYARQALKDGLTLQDTKSFNPYKFGFGAAADSHNTAVPYRQDNFFGGHAAEDGSIETRMGGHNFAGIDVRLESTAGLTGVWAEENTRASLFEAMQRKETFAVSGPRIKVRLFGGWEYTPDMLGDKDWVKTGYAKGVPMGGDLPPARAKAPTFMVWAVKDPRRATSIASRSSRAGRGAARASRRSSTWSGRAIASRPRGPAWCRRSAARWTSRMRRTRTRSARSSSRRYGPIPSSIRACTPSTTPACWRSRRRAGPRSRPSSSACPLPTSWPPPSRSAHGAHPSGTRRAPRLARTPSRASPWPT
jgi:hypothetical protein